MKNTQGDTELAQISNEELAAFAHIAEKYRNDPDPVVRAFSSLGFIAKDELERRKKRDNPERES